MSSREKATSSGGGQPPHIVAKASAPESARLHGLLQHTHGAFGLKRSKPLCFGADMSIVREGSDDARRRAAPGGRVLGSIPRARAGARGGGHARCIVESYGCAAYMHHAAPRRVERGSRILDISVLDEYIARAPQLFFVLTSDPGAADTRVSTVLEFPTIR